MSLRIPVGFAEASLQFTFLGSTKLMISSLGIDLTTGFGADQTNTDNILNTMKDALEVPLSADWNVAPFKVVYGQDGADVTFFGTGTTDAGDAAGAALPPGNAVLVRKVTLLGGRRNQGRMFIPGVREGNTTVAGTLSGGEQTAWQTAVSAMQTNLVALAAVDAIVLLHNEAPFDPTPIASLIVQSLTATQRRRLR
jgi:hypothetical protein